MIWINLVLAGIAAFSAGLCIAAMRQARRIRATNPFSVDQAEREAAVIRAAIRFIEDGPIYGLGTSPESVKLVAAVKELQQKAAPGH